MIQESFTKLDFDVLMGGKDITQKIPSHGMRGFLLQNISPYFFVIKDDIGATMATVAPWTYITGSITQSTSNLTLVSRLDLPAVNVNGTTSSSFHLEYELSIDEQTPSIIQLSVSAAANVTVINDSITNQNASQYHSGNGNAALNFTQSMYGFSISNDSSSNLTFTIGADTYTLFPGESFEEKFKSFTGVTITSSGAWRCYGLGN
jgi:hypothetical protein